MFRLGNANRQSLIVSMCGQVRMKGVGLMHKSHSEERGTGFLPIIERKKIIKTRFLGQEQASNNLYVTDGKVATPP